MPDDLKHKFGKRLRYLRRGKDITQEQLSEMIGRSVNFLSLIETGESAPSFETIEKIAQALKIEVSDLFLFDNNKPS